ncbi:hypothetical protein SAMN05661012_04648 [Chitinophaga sancti]|uniref:Uncharacterized protein n=1 Tax=Chitinophaga sancti TaxID=1004 RepID=A0A1K1S238_9BACT|nr:hypothetical protein SAMN05661012_04648 [Chitinophaga sancti]
MSNVKISSKGKALLQRGYSSSKIASAIVREGRNLFDRNGLTVKVDNYSVTIKSAQNSTSSTKK